MFDIELNLVSDFVVVLEAMLDLVIYKESKVIVEAKKVILLALVDLECLLDDGWLSFWSDVSRTTVEAMTVNRSEWLNEDALLLTDDSLSVVKSSTMVAAVFTFLDSNHDIIRDAKMDKGVDSSSELLKKLSLSNASWEVCKDESISTNI